MNPVCDAALEVENLHKRYSSVQALRGLSFTVPRGAFFGLFGRNGAGKTTALDIASGLLTRDSGRVTVLGEPLRLELSPETKARLGYAAGHLQLHFWMTCRRHIELAAACYPNWDEERARELLDVYRLPMDQIVASLSPGQNFQLQLVMVLAHRPDLLLIDEPGNLDAVVRQELMAQVIEAIAEEQATVVMASHIISELEGVCDHMCIIDQGIALTAGPVETLTQRVRRLHLRGVPESVRLDELATQGAIGVERVDSDVRAVLADYTPERADELAKACQAESYEAETLALQDLFVALTRDSGSDEET